MLIVVFIILVVYRQLTCTVVCDDIDIGQLMAVSVDSSCSTPPVVEDRVSLTTDIDGKKSLPADGVIEYDKASLLTKGAISEEDQSTDDLIQNANYVSKKSVVSLFTNSAAVQQRIPLLTEGDVEEGGGASVSSLQSVGNVPINYNSLMFKGGAIVENGNVSWTDGVIVENKKSFIEVPIVEVSLTENNQLQNAKKDSEEYNHASVLGDDVSFKGKRSLVIGSIGVGSDKQTLMTDGVIVENGQTKYSTVQDTENFSEEYYTAFNTVFQNTTDIHGDNSEISMNISYNFITTTFNNNSYYFHGMAVSAHRLELLKRFTSLYPTDLWKSYGIYSDSFLGLVHDCWLYHRPPPPVVSYTLAVVYVVVMVVGVGGNATVMCLFIRCRPLRTPANILVFNLAISDFLLLCNMCVFVFNSVLRGPALGNVGCQLYGFIGGLTGTTSIMTLSTIAYDRYNVIVHPMEPMRRTRKARAVSMVLVTWIYGGVFSVLPLLDVGVNPYKPEGFLTSCSFDYLESNLTNRLYIVAFFIAAWVIPVSGIFYCYLKIIRTVLTMRKIALLDTDVSRRHCRRQDKNEVKLSLIIAGIVLLWIISWTPYAIVALLGISGQQHWITPTSSMLPALFCKFASCVDPFVYALSHPHFRKYLSRVAKKNVRKRNSEKLNRRTVERQVHSFSESGD